MVAAHRPRLRRLPIVQGIFWELVRKAGIYYYDLAPRNVRFEGDPR